MENLPPLQMCSTYLYYWQSSDKTHVTGSDVGYYMLYSSFLFFRYLHRYGNSNNNIVIAIQSVSTANIITYVRLVGGIAYWL